MHTWSAKQFFLVCKKNNNKTQKTEAGAEENDR